MLSRLLRLLGSPPLVSEERIQFVLSLKRRFRWVQRCYLDRSFFCVYEYFACSNVKFNAGQAIGSDKCYTSVSHHQVPWFIGDWNDRFFFHHILFRISLLQILVNFLYVLFQLKYKSVFSKGKFGQRVSDKIAFLYFELWYMTTAYI